MSLDNPEFQKSLISQIARLEERIASATEDKQVLEVLLAQLKDKKHTLENVNENQSQLLQG